MLLASSVPMVNWPAGMKTMASWEIGADGAGAAGVRWVKARAQTTATPTRATAANARSGSLREGGLMGLFGRRFFPITAIFYTDQPENAPRTKPLNAEVQ